MDNHGEDAKISAAKDARALVATVSIASFATSDVATGAPYSSLVAVAEIDGDPLLLLSGLARHTRNVVANPRASLLFATAFGAGTGSRADPLTEPRVTFIGQILRSIGDQDRAAFLDRHHAAAAYADFADFSFYRLKIDVAHFIGGFGRIIELSAADLRASA